jgi:hypothetical protein
MTRVETCRWVNKQQVGSSSNTSDLYFQVPQLTLAWNTNHPDLGFLLFLSG